MLINQMTHGTDSQKAKTKHDLHVQDERLHMFMAMHANQNAI